MKLQTQFSIVFIPLLLLSGGGLMHFARKAIHKAILEEEVSRGQAKLEEVATESVSGFETQNENLLLPILTSALTKQSAVYVMAVDPMGKVLAHTDVLEKGKNYDDAASRDALKTDQPTSHEISDRSLPVLDLSWPVWGSGQRLNNAAEDLLFIGSHERTRLGTLRMGFPLTNARVVERKIVGQLAFLLLSIDVLLLGLAFLLMRGILYPVGRLVQATEEIGAGVYGSTIPIPGAQELALLAQSFNRMSMALKATTVSKDFFDNILSNMLEPLIIVNPDNRIRMVNRATLEMLGYQAQEMIDQPISILSADMDTCWSEVVENGVVKDCEVLFKTKESVTISVLFSGTAFKDTEGRPAGFIIVAKDMRERKRMESEMLQSGKLSAVGKLASGVAHEINNPLGVILGFAEGVLFDLKPDDPLQFPLKSIEREAIRCRNLVQDLLTFSRVSKSEREPVELNKTVESACTLVATQARLKKVEMDLQLASDLPHILGNPNQIQQIVINLANNGLDAMKAGGTLKVCTGLVNEAGQSWVLLSVSDTGSGIPADILPRIFEPFFTTKPVGQGTGLGLGLVHEIVQKHSGKISVDSVPGRTCFLVKFPASSTR